MMALTRLKKRVDFLRVAQAKIAARTQTVIVQCISAMDTDNDEDILRVGFTASRRVGNAVFRNRAKRRLRAIVGNELEQLVMSSCRGSYDFVFIAVPATANCEFAKLYKDFSQAVKSCLLQVSSAKGALYKEESCLD